MNAEITREMIMTVTNELAAKSIFKNDLQSQIEKDNKRRPLSKLAQSMTAYSKPQETESEISKLKSALKSLSPDVSRGNGSVFIHDGQPADDYWLGIIWTIASLSWTSGKELAIDWSKQAPKRYKEDEFDEHWNAFNPNHENAVGIGSLYKLAGLLGWTPMPLSSLSSIQKNISKLNKSIQRVFKGQSAL